ncbi:MAG: globin [Frankiales bacterium]|nr:globin [Frankiales bacterium]
MSLYERLGSDQGIRAAVDEFYARLLADPALVSYFEGADMKQLRAHQAQLLIQVTGGPIAYSGRELAVAHKGLAITPQAFDRVVEHLASTLADLGVAQEDIAQVGGALVAHRDVIVEAAA